MSNIKLKISRFALRICQGRRIKVRVKLKFHHPDLYARKAGRWEFVENKRIRIRKNLVKIKKEGELL